MQVIHGTDDHDLIEGSEGADVLVGGAGSDTYVVNSAGDLIIEQADVEVPGALSWWSTSAAEPITLVRTSADVFCVRIQIEGAPDGVFAEFVLENVDDGVFGIQRLRVADQDGHIPETVLSDSESVWEYAFQLGRPNPNGDPTEFEFYGGGHGNQTSVNFGITLDGIDFSALPIGTPVNGVKLDVQQDLEIQLPSDGVTPAGSVLLQHIFDASGMSVQHAHAYLPGFELSTAYSAMLPTTGAYTGGVDFMQVGARPPVSIDYDGSQHHEPGTHDVASAWGTSHPYILEMSLPSGGPDVNGDWSNASASGMWIYDTAVDYAKIYLNWLTGLPSPAADSAHIAHYSVSLGDLGAAPTMPPLGPRSASQGVDTILSSISLTLPENVEILRLTGGENLSGFGNRLNNTILGNAGDNTLDGGGGANLLYGGAGNDTYLVRSEDDYIGERADEGVDTVLTFLASHTLARHFENLAYLGREDFTATGNAAENRIQGGAGNDILRGLDGDDELSGGAGDDTLVGGLGSDHLIGGAGVNTLLGEEGDDLIDSRGGSGTVQGGVGNDVYLVDDRTISVIEVAGEGRDEVRTASTSYMLGVEIEGLTYTGADGFSGIGNALANDITGGGAGDLLNGAGGDDRLFGLGGSDLMIGGAGDNLLDGGAGSDNAYYAASPSGVAVDLRTGVASNGFGGVDTLVGIENVTGASFDDWLAGNDLANVLNGGEGDDTLSGGAGGDALLGGSGVDVVTYAAAAVGVDVRLHLGVARNDGHGFSDSLSGIENVIGSALNDLITGDAGRNTLSGGLGADTLIGFGGDDVLIGGAGALNTLQGGLGDDVYVIEASDTIVELAGEGLDTVRAHVNTHVLSANVENLVFVGAGDFVGTGNAGANVISGGDGADVLRGRGGADVLNGGAGSDTADYTLAAGPVTARIDRQHATNDGDGSADTFNSIENLIGSNFNDLLIGDGGANVLKGGVGVDTLLGMAGNDILWGGAAGGNNQLQGGQGDDYYVLEAADTVVEFEGEGIDTVEARVATHVLRANVENLIFTGTTKFTGAGNALDNIITGGSQDDILRGGGGNDIIHGGLGRDELVLRGLAGDYTVAAEGDGWRIVDAVSGRDGSTFVSSIEVLRFADNATQTVAASPASPGKAPVPLVLPAVTPFEVEVTKLDVPVWQSTTGDREAFTDWHGRVVLDPGRSDWDL